MIHLWGITRSCVGRDSFTCVTEASRGVEACECGKGFYKATPAASSCTACEAGVCMWVCVHAYTCVCFVRVYMRQCVCVDVWMCGCVNVWMCVCAYVCVYSCVYGSMSEYACVYVRVCVHVCVCVWQKLSPNSILLISGELLARHVCVVACVLLRVCVCVRARECVCVCVCACA